jgi:hypothetical protein
MRISPPKPLYRHTYSWAALRLLAALAVLAIFCLVPAAWAQSRVSRLATLEIELWPDYDQSAVLVLLTGTLPDDVPAPATVALPLPVGDRLHAVAYKDEASGNFVDIIDYDAATPGQVTFSTPSPTFHMEYYFPYTADGEQREFTFSWRSDMSVENLLLNVQQPVDATNFQTSPAADRTSTKVDGLVYHALASRTLPAGQSVSVTVTYVLAGGQLSADRLAVQQPSVEGPLPLVSSPAQSNGQSSSPELKWPLVALVAGGLIIIAAVAWFLYTNSRTTRRRRPRPRPNRAIRSSRPAPGSTSPSSPSAAQFCHHCGQPVDEEDRFCRACGTPLKGR